MLEVRYVSGAGSVLEHRRQRSHGVRRATWNWFILLILKIWKQRDNILMTIAHEEVGADFAQVSQIDMANPVGTIDKAQNTHLFACSD
jgi:Uri superfamily endonuclease